MRSTAAGSHSTSGTWRWVPPGLKEAASFLQAAAVPLLAGLREMVAVLEAGTSPQPLLGCLAESLAWPGEEVPAPSWRRFPVWLH